MVGHLHIGVQLATGGSDRLPKPFAIGEVVVFREETGVPVMPTWHNVQRQTSEVNSGTSGHGG